MVAYQDCSQDLIFLWDYTWFRGDCIRVDPDKIGGLGEGLDEGGQHSKPKLLPVMLTAILFFMYIHHVSPSHHRFRLSFVRFPVYI